MSRYRACAIHVGISLAIFAVILWMIVGVWYPGFFFETDGGWQGIRLLFLVDVVLGPTLTLIVFKAGKPGLKFDLSAIAFAQTLALTGGLWVVHDERPLALVYVDGQFFSLSRHDYAEAKVDVPDLGAIPGPYPKRIQVALPDDPIEQSEIRSRMLRSNVPLRLLTDHYVPFTPSEQTLADAFDTKVLEERDQEHHQLARWVAAHGGTLDDYRFFPYGARYRFAFIGYRAATRECVGILDIAAPNAPERAG